MAASGLPELKALVKTCLRELVMEGSLLPVPAYQHAQSIPTSNNSLQQLVSSTARQLSNGDPQQAKLFESILSDTAQTTLQDTLVHDRQGYTPQQAQQDKQELGKFGKPTVSRWAELAFNKQERVLKLPG